MSIKRRIGMRAWMGGTAAAVLTVTLIAALSLWSCTAQTGQDNAQSGSNEPTPAGQRAPIPADAKIAVIHTNDIHGRYEAANPTEANAGCLGIAAVAQLKADYEEKGYQVLLLDDGDAIQDTTLVNLSQGETAVEFLNSAGYDALALGNHEFGWGADNITALEAQADFPFLAANVVVEATGEPFVQANTVIELEDGIKVGVFGLTAPGTQTSMGPKNVAGLAFLEGEDLYRCAQEQVDGLRAQGCSLVICLGHLGNSEFEAPSRALDVIENTEGIDLFIDGHDHVVENETLGNTLMVSTGCYLEYIGLALYENGGFTEALVAPGNYSGSDAHVAQLVAQTAGEIDTQLAQVIGFAEVAMDGTRAPGVRTQETNLGDFAADAMLWQARQVSDTAVDAAIVNGGAIRESIAAGDITIGTMKTVFPYENVLSVVTVTGAELLEALEAATFSLPDATASFPQVAGITYTVDTSVPYEQGAQYPGSTFYAPADPGARVTIADVGGKGFSLDDSYVIAASSFLTSGGDTYYAFAKAYNENGYITGISDSETLMNYLQDPLAGVIGQSYAETKDRITVN